MDSLSGLHGARCHEVRSRCVTGVPGDSSCVLLCVSVTSSAVGALVSCHIASAVQPVPLTFAVGQGLCHAVRFWIIKRSMWCQTCSELAFWSSPQAWGPVQKQAAEPSSRPDPNAKHEALVLGWEVLSSRGLKVPAA